MLRARHDRRSRTVLLLCAVGLAVASPAVVPALADAGSPHPAVREAALPPGDRLPVTPQVTGGHESRGNAYPWMSALYVAGAFRCGAQLVAPTWVLTAAHCVPGSNASRLSVLIGQSDLAGGKGGERRAVRTIRRHPGYRAGSGGALVDDLALLELRTPSTKQPLLVASTLERDVWDAGRRVRALGWGRVSERGARSDKLREVDLPVQGDAVMAKAYGRRFAAGVMLGAGPLSGGRDTCTGDSGGPLVAGVHGSWRLVGITSWGDGCGRAGKPGVYTRVADDPLVTFVRSWVAAPSDGSATRSGDVNGDGKDDLVGFTRGTAADVYVALSTGTRFAGTATKWHDGFAGGEAVPLVGDFDGDGKDDVAAVVRGAGGGVDVALSTGTRFGRATRWHGPAPVDAVPLVGDFDGDGKDDIALVSRGGSGAVRVALSDGARFGGDTTWAGGTVAPGAIPLAGDFDGDGKDDIATVPRGTDAGVRVALSDGGRFTAGGTPWQARFAPGAAFPAAGDVNGDGKDDVVAFTRGAAADVSVVLSDGSRFAGTPATWNGAFSPGNDLPGLADVDGDGKADALAFTRGPAADVYVARSDGRRFAGAGVKWQDRFAAGSAVPAGVTAY